MSTNSPEVFLELDRTRPRALRTQLEQGLRTAIRAGRLRAGTRLPASRALAADLRITRGVVVAAYQQLVAEGYLTSRQGSGTVVNSITVPERQQLGSSSPADVRFDFRPGAPDVALFPHSAWARASREAMRSLPAEALGYGDAAGLPVLRATLADYLRRVRGLSCDADEIVVCNGFSHGLSVLAQVFTERGIAVEEPGNRSWRVQIEGAGAGCHAVAVDGNGLRVDLLAAIDADAVLVTPAHQSPTGVVLSAGRRVALVEWARATGGYIIEDDYDAEYRYDGAPVGALQGVAPDHVIHAGSLSKSLAPGLRLGWLVVPPALRDAVVAARARSDRFTTSIVQAAVARFIQQGDLDRQLRRTRRSYHQRRDALIAALRQYLPECHPSGISAGLHVLVHLPRDVVAADLAATATRHGILVQPLDHYLSRPPADHSPALVVGYSRHKPHHIEEGIQHLAAIIKATARR